MGKRDRLVSCGFSQSWLPVPQEGESSERDPSASAGSVSIRVAEQELLPPLEPPRSSGAAACALLAVSR